MRMPIAILCLLAATVAAAPRPVRAADALVDSAVTSLAQLTDPHRLELLREDDFRAQLGPALGWLHVARHEDVSPEAVIARALARNGLDGERARLTREALLRNLARADAWELFDHPDSARALSDGKPVPIPAGIHRGHLAEAAVILPDGLGPKDRREFACLVLRADDENPPRPPHGSHRRQPGDMLAHNASPTPVRRFISPPPAAAMAVKPNADNDGPLPVAYTTTGRESGKVAVREEVTVDEPVSLAALGGPAWRFVLRGADDGSVRFELIEDSAGPSAPVPPPPRTFSTPLAQGPAPEGKARVWRIYEEPGGLKISLYDAAPEAMGNVRTVLFEFAPGSRETAADAR